MRVRCTNGLCDRLAMIFSRLYLLKQRGETLTVCWEIDEECNGHFLDIFEPVQGLEFTEDTSEVDFWGWEPAFDPRSTFLYRGLSLRPEIRSEVDDLRRGLGDYVAVHVRRTDKLDPLKAPRFVDIPNSDFYDFIDQYDSRVFLAADCRGTQDSFRQRYGDRLFCSSEIVPVQSLRQTPLKFAAIDLFTCIHARSFMGNPRSGFSRMIEQFRTKKAKTL